MSEIKYEARKNRVLGVVATLVCTLIILIFIYFRSKTNYTALPAIKQEAISKEQIAEIDKLNISLEKYNEEKRRNVIDNRIRDSVMVAEIRLNRKAIAKIKISTNENINKIQRFTDPQLSTAISSLPRSIR